MSSTLPSILLALALLLVISLLLRLRREHDQAFNELPTGVCGVIGEQIDYWNLELSRLSGIEARSAVGAHLSELPAPWPSALRDVLDAADGKVVKRSLPGVEDGKQRWVILHSSPRRGGARRLVMIEDITDYQQLQDELLHRERLASIGRLAAGVAHEIGNPVTGIACIAQNLRDVADPADVEQASAEILKQTDRVSRTLSTLMQLSHPGSAVRDIEVAPCNIADCVDEAIHLLGLDRTAGASGFENRCDRELLASADGQLLLQVFLNLLDNARSAAAGDGRVLVDACADDERVHITVDNGGPAVPAPLLVQVFEPFFTTKDVGEGTGLGLPLVRRMLEDMGGEIELSSPSPVFASCGVRAAIMLRRAEYDGAPAGST